MWEKKISESHLKNFPLLLFNAIQTSYIHYLSSNTLCSWFLFTLFPTTYSISPWSVVCPTSSSRAIKRWSENAYVEHMYSWCLYSSLISLIPCLSGGFPLGLAILMPQAMSKAFMSWSCNSLFCPPIYFTSTLSSYFLSKLKAYDLTSARPNLTWT